MVIFLFNKTLSLQLKPKTLTLMKKYFLLLISAMILIGCGNKKPVETSISKYDVELMGNAFNSFRLGGEVRLLMTPNVDNDSKWMIRATVPLQKVDNMVIDELTADINLLDANSTKVREGFTLAAEDLASVVPVFNATPNAEKTLVFSAGDGMKKDFTYKEASDLIEKVKKVNLTLNASKVHGHVGSINVNENDAMVQSSAEVALRSEQVTTAEKATMTTTETTTVKKEKNEKDEPLTLNSLLKQYGIYGMLSQYEKHWKNGDRRKAKEVEDRMWEIEKKVSANSSIPKDLRERFVRYIEDKEDEIEHRY